MTTRNLNEELVNQLLIMDKPVNDFNLYPQWKATLTDPVYDLSPEVKYSLFYSDSKKEVTIEELEETGEKSFIGFFFSDPQTREDYEKIENKALFTDFSNAPLLSYIASSFVFSVPARMEALMALDLFLEPAPSFGIVKNLRSKPLNIHLWERVSTWRDIDKIEWYEAYNHEIEKEDQPFYLYNMVNLVLKNTYPYNVGSDRLDTDVMHFVKLWYEQPDGLNHLIYEDWVKDNFAAFAAEFDEKFFEPMGNLWIAFYYLFTKQDKLSPAELDFCIKEFNEEYEMNLTDAPLTQILSIFNTLHSQEDEMFRILNLPADPYFGANYSDD